MTQREVTAKSSASPDVEFAWEPGPAGRPEGAGRQKPRKVLMGVGLVLFLLAGAALAMSTTRGDQHGSANVVSAAKPSALAAPVSSGSPWTVPSSTQTPIATPAQLLNPVPTDAPTTALTVLAQVPPKPSPQAAPPQGQHATSAPTVITPVPTGPPQPIGSWGLHDGSGTTAVDTAGGHNGSTENTTWVGGAAEFNGSDSEITVPDPVVDTGPGHSFTVAAWVYLGNESGFVTAVSQDGAVNSGFYLEYDKTDDRWAFARQAVDADGSTPYRALSSAPPQVQTWTPLIGVFNGATGQLQIYVNGQPEGTATDPTPFAATGSLVFGRSIASGGLGGWFPGLIDDVAVFDQALTAAQIHALGSYS